MHAMLRWLLCLWLPTAAAAAPSHPPAVELLGVIHNLAIEEISGAAVSQRDHRYLFGVNDSQNSAALQVIKRDGGVVSTISVNGARNRDWEDLAPFTFHGRPYLLIADTGDNGGVRDSLELIVVAEPEWPLPSTIDVAWRIRFRLAEGARDIEAVSVDSAKGVVYLIAKRHFPRVLYRLPLRPADDAGTLTARRIGTFTTLRPASKVEIARDPVFGRFHGDITSLALDPAGRFALVLSYRDLYLYPRSAGQTLLSALRGKPVRMHLPPMPQPESIALDVQQRSAIVLSEKMLSPIYQVKIP